MNAAAQKNYMCFEAIQSVGEASRPVDILVAKAGAPSQNETKPASLGLISSFGRSADVATAMVYVQPKRLKGRPINSSYVSSSTDIAER